MRLSKRLLGIAIWILLGFMVNCLCVGIGVTAFFMINYLPWYHTALGTLAGCIAVFLYAITDTKGKNR